MAEPKSRLYYLLNINKNGLNNNVINQDVLDEKGLNNIKGALDNTNKGALDNTNKGASRRAPTTKTLGFIIGMFKTECTKQINKINKTPGIKIFQRNYYEHIMNIL
jgi:hypothetical protein